MARVTKDPKVLYEEALLRAEWTLISAANALTKQQQRDGTRYLERERLLHLAATLGEEWAESVGQG